MAFCEVPLQPSYSDTVEVNIQRNAINRLSIDLVTQDATQNNFYQNHEEVNICLKLKDRTDEQLLEEIKLNLPKWRKKMGIEEPQHFVKGRKDDIDKIRRYQLIAYIDLVFWSDGVDKTIKKSVLVSALYPNGEKGETELKQTVEPHLKKVIHYGYRKVDK